MGVESGMSGGANGAGVVGAGGFVMRVGDLQRADRTHQEDR